MKNWIKALLSISLGVLFGTLLPADIIVVNKAIEFLARLAINIGIYILIPMLFVSLVVEVFELARQRRLMKIFLKSVLLLTCSTFMLAIIGAVAMVIYHNLEPGLSASLAQNLDPELIYSDILVKVPEFTASVFEIFPSNFGQIFFPSSGLIISVGIAAYIIGYNLTFDKFATKPVVLFFDSLSKVLQHINYFFIEITSITLVFITTYFFMSLRMRLEYKWLYFIPFILFLILLSVFVIFIVYPAILFFIFKIKNPYKLLWGIFVPTIVGFFSGNVLLSHGMLFGYNDRNLGTEPVIGIYTNSFFTMISRAGTTLVTVCAFIMVLKINDAMNVTFWSVMFSILFAIILVPFTGSIPYFGVPFSLIIMCNIYGHGTTINGVIYLMLPVLSGVAAALDTVTSSFISYLVSQESSINRDIKIGDFI